jgi:magnesium-protoporphyrin O-methyltransferase
MPCEEMFTPRSAQKSLERYRKDGLGELERRIVASSTATGVEGARVLELGGGIGAIQAELLAAGAAVGEVVELVPGYEPYARELAHEKGVADRTSFVVADVLDSPAVVEPADVVVLNRVVCCSPDGVELTAAAARLTRRALVLSYPRDVWWLRLGASAMNAGLWMLRRSFRVFVHRPAALAAAAEAAGLGLTESGRTGPWEFATFGRVT